MENRITLSPSIVKYSQLALQVLVAKTWLWFLKSEGNNGNPPATVSAKVTIAAPFDFWDVEDLVAIF